MMLLFLHNLKVIAIALAEKTSLRNEEEQHYVFQ